MRIVFSKRNRKILFWSLFGLFMLFMGLRSRRMAKSLKQHCKTTVGVMTKVRPDDGMANLIDYTYSVKGNEYATSRNTDMDLYPLREILKRQKYFLVAYDSLDPKNAKILISREDYTLYSIPLPDSMSSVFIWAE